MNAAHSWAGVCVRYAAGPGGPPKPKAVAAVAPPPAATAPAPTPPPKPPKTLTPATTPTAAPPPVLPQPTAVAPSPPRQPKSPAVIPPAVEPTPPATPPSRVVKQGPLRIELPHALPPETPGHVASLAADSPLTYHQAAGTRIVEGTGKRQQATISDVANFLSGQVRKQYRRELDPRKPRDMDAMVKQAVADVRYQLGGDTSGEHWYSDDITTSFRLSSKIIKEFADNEALRVVMTAVTGILANRPSPKPNWIYAVRSMEEFLKTGKFPRMNPDSGKHWPTYDPHFTQKQFQVLENILAKHDLEGTARFLLSRHDPKKLARYVHGMGVFKGLPTYAGDRVFGMMVFGPKLGMFGLNMNGLGEETIDKWMTRAFHIQRGSSDVFDPNSQTGLRDTPRGEGERDIIKQWLAAVAAAVGKDRRAVQAMKWVHIQRAFDSLGVSTPTEYFSDGIRELLARRNISESGAPRFRHGGGVRGGHVAQAGREFESTPPGRGGSHYARRPVPPLSATRRRDSTRLARSWASVCLRYEESAEAATKQLAAPAPKPPQKLAGPVTTPPRPVPPLPAGAMTWGQRVARLREGQPVTAHEHFAQPLPSDEHLSHPQLTQTDLVGASANQVRRHRLPGGALYYHKTPRRWTNPAEPFVEGTVAGLLRQIGFGNVPPGEVRWRGATPTYLTAGAPGVPLVDVVEGKHLSDDNARELRHRFDRKNPPHELANWLTATWLVNASDRHESNYKVGQDGTLYPLDFGFGLHHHKDEEPVWSFNQDALIQYGLVHPTQPLDRKFLRHLLDLEPHLLGRAQQGLAQLPPEYDAWRSQAVRNLKGKFRALRRLIARPGATLGDLPRDDSARLSYNESGDRRPNVWEATKRPEK